MGLGIDKQSWAHNATREYVVHTSRWWPRWFNGGTETFRNNLPAGCITATDECSLVSAALRKDGLTWWTFFFPSHPPLIKKAYSGLMNVTFEAFSWRSYLPSSHDRVEHAPFVLHPLSCFTGQHGRLVRCFKLCSKRLYAKTNKCGSVPCMHVDQAALRTSRSFLCLVISDVWILRLFRVCGLIFLLPVVFFISAL